MSTIDTLRPSQTDTGSGTGGTPRLPAWTEPGTRAYLRTSLALFLAGFATFSLLYCVQPLLPLFAADFHTSAAQSSLALSLSTGALALAILCTSAFSESLGRRGLMCGSIVLASVCNLAAALAPSWHTLLLARALEGIALGGVPAVAMAYLAEEIHPRGLGLSMGLYVSGSAFGGMAGRVVVGMISDYHSWRLALAVISIAGLLAAAGFVALLPPSRNFVRRKGLTLAHHLQAWGAHLRHPGLPYLFIIGGLVMGVFVTVYNYVGFRLMLPEFGLTQTQIGLIFTAYLLGIVASSAAGALADRIGRAPVLVGGALTSVAGVLLTLPHSVPAIVGGVALLTIGFFSVHSVASSWVGRLSGKAKGHAAALYLLTYYVGSSVLGSAGGWFWEHGGWNALSSFGLVLLAVMLAIALHLRGLVKRGVPA